MKSAKTILFIMPDAFHLGWLGSTRRTFHLAEAFNSFGFESSLLMGRVTVPLLQQPVCDKFPGEIIQTRHSGDYPRIIETSRILKRGWRAFWKLTGRERYFEKLSMGWGDNLDVDELTGSLHRLPDIVWGMGGGYLDGAVAASRISRRLGVPWVMELHDPPYHAGLGEDLETICCRMKNLVGVADRVVVNTRAYAVEVARRFQKPSEKVDNLFLSYGGEPGWKKPVNEKMTMVYAGSLSKSRGLSSLLEGLRIARAVDSSITRHIVIKLYGLESNFESTIEEARKLGLESCIRMCGHVHADAMDEVLANSDVIIMVQSALQSVFEIPGKVFECMKHGKATLAIMPQCETGDMLEMAGIGFVLDESRTDEIAKQLLDFKNIWLSNGHLPCYANWEYIRQFSMTGLRGALGDIIRQFNSSWINA